jgi:hypothetical protein
MDIGINVLKKEGGWDSYRIRPIDDVRHSSDVNTVKLILQYDPNYKRRGARQNQGLPIIATHSANANNICHICSQNTLPVQRNFSLHRCRRVCNEVEREFWVLVHVTQNCG